MLSLIPLLFYVLYASYLGIKVSYLFPWTTTDNCVYPSLPAAVGLSFAPFILGLFTIFSLYFFSGHATTIHLMVVLGLLCILHCIVHGCVTCQNRRGNRAADVTVAKNTMPWSMRDYGFGVILLAWVILLFFNSFYYPLYENDALEYMTVARQLYHTHSLASYPMINQEPTTSGFYGPWTHPPMYVALLYFMHLIQGHAFSPGLARLIAPWAAFLTTLLIYVTGSIHQRLTGILGALLFISTPLLFLGATRSSIDSLTVLGFALVFTVLVGCNDKLVPVTDAETMTGVEKFKSKNGLLGLALGCALWAHSQTILLIPMLMATLCLYFGLNQWKQACKAFVIVLSTALLIAVWPYLHNYMLFGSLISDSPLVFAEPGLKWNEYFSYARGLNNGVAIVQYGIFKGWFAIEALGVSFWLMTIGALILMKRFFVTVGYKKIIMQGLCKLSNSDKVLSVALLLLIIYIAGTIASVMIGLDLMIKNERYLLVILPFVSIVGGYGADSIICKLDVYFSKSLTKRSIYFILSAGVLLLILLATYFVGIHSPKKYIGKIQYSYDKTTHELIINPESIHTRLLRNLPSTQLSLRIRTEVPENALILAFRPADMYYSNKKMVSYLDPRLLPMYREKNPTQAVRMLLNLGVNYIQIPDYLFPVQYNSVIQDILRDPQLSHLVISNNGNELYQLVHSNARAILITDFTPGTVAWSYFKRWNIRGLTKLLTWITQANWEKVTPLKTNRYLDFTDTFPLNHRQYSHAIISHATPLIYGEEAPSMLTIIPGHAYRVDFDLIGDGFIHIYMAEETAKRQPIIYYDGFESWLSIGELVLSRSHNEIVYSKRFIAKGNTVTFMIDIMGSSNVMIKHARLYEIKE